MGKAPLRRLFHAFAAVVVALLAVGLYRAKSEAARTEAHVRELRAEIAARQAHVRELRSEIAELENPANIEALARARTDLVIGRESAALPEATIDDALPPPREGAP
jgi:hypothetical protein